MIRKWLVIRIKMKNKLELSLSLSLCFNPSTVVCPECSINVTVWNSLWALRDDDGGGQAARARLARRFNFIGQPVTVGAAHTQTRWTRKGRHNPASAFQGLFLWPCRAHLSSSLSVGTLWYQYTKASSVVNTQFLQEDCSSRIWAKTSNSCWERGKLGRKMDYSNS